MGFKRPFSGGLAIFRFSSSGLHVKLSSPFPKLAESVLFSFTILGLDGKYEPVLIDNAYKVHMKLTIKSVTTSDYGSYKCISRNSLGETDGEIKLYRKS